MKKTHTQRRVLNHYSTWKYLVLVTTITILALSAIPTWFGEKPSIQMTLQPDSPYAQSPMAIANLLQSANISVSQITQQGEKTTLVFADEQAQSKARSLLDATLSKDDTITFAYVSVAPGWLSKLGFAPIKLGLDLRGGVQFLLDVDVDKAFALQRDALIDELQSALREQRMRGVRVRAASDNTIMADSNSEAGRRAVQSFIQQHYPNWQLTSANQGLLLVPTEQSMTEFQTTTVAQNLKIMRDRIEELGITEAMVQRQGKDKIRIELPGVQDPAQAKNVIGATASLAFYEVLFGENVMSSQRLVLKDNNGQNVVVAKRPVLTGEHIVNARAGVDEMGMSQVNISLDQAGGKKISDFSETHIHKPMATVYREYTKDETGATALKERVISVATIQSKLGSQFRITGAGSMVEAQELALLLRAGSLTAPVTLVEERTIGASLGAENINNGFAALALGMGLTLLFMACWYRRLGWVANVALCANMVCLLGLIALIPGSVLTLPGIAGLVLTVGMAVDTNVIIFERIKDKMREGRSFAQAIDAGFDSAFATILDANVTTMITAVILYTIGNGPIQGFSLTLGLGLLTSMFTGVFASRVMINLIWGRDARRDVRV